MDDCQTISAVLGGDKAQYGKLIEKHKRMVHAIAWSHLGDADLSEDVAQETFVKAYCYLGTLREPDRFSSWLARIARNVCNSFRRRAKREDAFKRRWAILEAAEPQEPEESRESLEEQMWSSFAQLPEIHREALTVFYIEDKSTGDLAAVLGISESAARTRLHRARIALREQLAERLEDALDNLQPSKQFTHSVMVLLPLSPKGVALGTGGAIAGMGKLSASVSFALWPFLASLVVMVTVVKMELANIIDTPQNRFRKTIARRALLVPLLGGAVLGAALTFVSVGLGHSRGGIQAGYVAFCKLMVLYLLPLGYLSIRALRVSRSFNAVFLVAMIVVFLGVYAAVGFFNAPATIPNYAMLILLVVCAVASFSGKTFLGRYDYSIFLRCATGGVAETDEEELSLPRRISDLQFVSFARFLGEEYLIRDYSLRPDRIVLKLSLLSGENITISRAGECEATVGARSLRSISKTIGSQVDKRELESKACRAVTAALGRFLNGDLAGAKSILTAQSDESILRTPMGKSLHWRLLAIFNVVFWLWLLLSRGIHHVK